MARAWAAVEMKLEVVVMPASDVDRAKRAYGNLGWRLDRDFSAGDDFRVIQFTPPGSGCSIIFGKNVPAAAPGSIQGLLLVVSDIVATRDGLLRCGIEIGELFHDARGVFHHWGVERKLHGPNPRRRSYATYAPFSDRDGNGWLLREVTVRLPREVETRGSGLTTDIGNCLRHAANG